MKIELHKTTIEFVPWKPEYGQVFSKPFALDVETLQIDPAAPWLAPTYVLGAACDDRQGYFLQREHVPAFLRAHQTVPLVMHHAPFDLDVLHSLIRQTEHVLDVYAWVDTNRVWDTELLHRLYVLGIDGHPAEGKGRATLERCAKKYLGIELPKDIVDSQGKPVRQSYGRWLGENPGTIEPVYLEYLAKDALATYLVYRKLRRRLRKLILETDHSAFGYVDGSWLQQQYKRWGPQTHHIQLKGAIVLRAITQQGLCIDTEQQSLLAEEVRQELATLKSRLLSNSYVPGQMGSGKALQRILRNLDFKYPELDFPLTATGKYKTSREVLEPLAASEPFVADLLAYCNLEKLYNTYLAKMDKKVLHPSFRPLLRTGRTSSFGEINSQNLPRDSRIRDLFRPPAGDTFIVADYNTAELGTLAQAVMKQFNTTSHMAAAINEGMDLHRLVASRVLGKPPEEVTSQERQAAKAINFGKPGGMGAAGLRNYARVSYGVDRTEEEIETLTGAWFELFPEMKEFLQSEGSPGEELAYMLELTANSQREFKGDDRFVQGADDEPDRVLGWMCLKVLRDKHPSTNAGVPYKPLDLDYFWTMAIKLKDILPARFHQDLDQRRPSWNLRKAVLYELGKGGVFTLTGRLRAKATYCARHNTVFQGLAADGAKLSLWRVWRAGYRLANFIHDELLIVVKNDNEVDHHARRIKELMIEGMREVVPDVRVDVEVSIGARWGKGASAIARVAEPVIEDAGCGSTAV